MSYRRYFLTKAILLPSVVNGPEFVAHEDKLDQASISPLRGDVSTIDLLLHVIVCEDTAAFVTLGVIDDPHVIIHARRCKNQDAPLFERHQ